MESKKNYYEIQKSIKRRNSIGWWIFVAMIVVEYLGYGTPAFFFMFMIPIATIILMLNASAEDEANNRMALLFLTALVFSFLFGWKLLTEDVTLSHIEKDCLQDSRVKDKTYCYELEEAFGKL